MGLVSAMAHPFHAAIFSLLLLPLAGAGLDFGETTRELHAAPDQNVITTDIDFKNTSGKTVTIERYEATCSCMGVKVKGGKLQ